MKKTIIFTGLLLVLMLGLASAVEIAPGEGDAAYNKNVISGLQEDIPSDAPRDGEMQQRRINAEATQFGGQQEGFGGQRMISENQEFRFQNSQREVKCVDCNLTESNGQVRATMSNGKNAAIKIMPEVASQRALERLRLHNCNETEGCSIELKEVGQGNDTRMAYEVRGKTKAKFLGIFATNAEVSTEIDAETGEVINTRKPWWAVLAKDKNETEENASA
ncbi:MAG: hypothetical protein PF542_02395 [Nanoarchaeota archaeon]|jgi:hypothetical protein|nr:hypothetical protein [Nanoarchaeota archaeon]